MTQKTYTIDDMNKLLDIMVECGIYGKEYFHGMSNEKYMEWVRKQLTTLGYKVEGPVGLTWVRLRE